jgi:hypothetical protein
MVLLVAVRVRGYMSIQQPNFAIFDGHIRVLELYTARHDALHLSSLKDSTGFVFVLDMVFVKRLTVGQYVFVDGHNNRSECKL